MALHPHILICYSASDIFPLIFLFLLLLCLYFHGLRVMWHLSDFDITIENIRSFSTNELMRAIECVSECFRLKLSFIEKYFLNFSIPDSRTQRTIVWFYDCFDLVHIFHGVKLISVANPFERIELDSIVSNDGLKMFCFRGSADLHFGWIASIPMYSVHSGIGIMH